MWFVIVVLRETVIVKSIPEFEINQTYLKVIGQPELCKETLSQKYKTKIHMYVYCKQCALLNLITLIKKYLLVRTYLVKLFLDLLITVKPIDCDIV